MRERNHFEKKSDHLPDKAGGTFEGISLQKYKGRVRAMQPGTGYIQ